MMNFGTKASMLIPRGNYFSHLQNALFHSTPVLKRRKREFWNSEFNCHSRRSRKLHLKQSMLHNLNAYADYILQSWENNYDEDDPSSSGGSSWFKPQYSRRTKRHETRNHHTWRRRGGKFEFCQDDDADEETIFRSAFGGNRSYFWSFINEENPQWRSSSGYYNYNGKNWRYQYEQDYDFNYHRSKRRYRDEDDYDSYSDSDNSESNLASHRLALGLSTSGPLKLEDVKKAYRACALKWHPDRHQGSSKAVAEERFKLCSSAYQFLCDNLAAA